MNFQKKLIIVIIVVILLAGAQSLMKTSPTLKDTTSTLARDMVVPEVQTVTSTPYKKDSFTKPSLVALRKTLTPLQYYVTQEDGTESPFSNEYDKNTAKGLYVDIVSGEPLFSSTDKYDSGTGWPSFVKPISAQTVVEKVSGGFFDTRTEIRSRVADSHLGHVFDDGPQDRGGKRYCMNSAAMKFIPKADMERFGYKEYIQFVE